jgi:hypothetical protein
LVLIANHKDNVWRNIPIKRGQKLTSLIKLSEQTGLTVQKVRTAISNLKSTNDITSQSSSQHTVFTVVNYDLYQGETSEATSKQQTENKQITTNKNDKNVKNEKNKYISDSRFDEFYDLYGKKTGGKKAKIKFDSLSNKEIDKIFEVVSDYVLSTPDKQYRKAPLVWLNGECWNDEIQKTLTLDCGIDFEAIAINFNKSMAIWEHVPEVVKVTEKQKKLISVLVSDHNMTNERFENYFEYCATDGKHDGVLNNVKFPAQGLTYFLSEDTIQK